MTTLMVVATGEPVDKKYTQDMDAEDFNAFASFDGDKSDSLALSPGSIGVGDSQASMAFEIMYRHPVINSDAVSEIRRWTETEAGREG